MRPLGQVGAGLALGTTAFWESGAGGDSLEAWWVVSRGAGNEAGEWVRELVAVRVLRLQFEGVGSSAPFRAWGTGVLSFLEIAVTRLAGYVPWVANWPGVVLEGGEVGKKVGNAK